MKKKQYSDIFVIFLLMIAGVIWFIIRMLNGGEILIPSYVTIFTSLLLAPVAEELFFRGILQKELGRRLSGGVSAISFANIIVSLMFALVHIPAWGVLHSMMVIIPSVTFGYIYDRSGVLFYPVILHIFYNLNIFIV